MIRSVAEYSTNHLAKQRAFIEAVRQQIGSRRPRMIVFHNEHAPFEPTRGAADILAKQYSRDDIEFVEIPKDHTPLGHALEAHDFLQEKSTALVKGGFRLAGFSAAENVDFGNQLLWVMRTISERAEELISIYNQGFQEGNGIAGKRIRSTLTSVLQDKFKDEMEKFEGMLDKLRKLKDYPPLLELVCQELSAFFPQAYFATLHLHWPGYLIYQMGMPDKTVDCTLAASEINIPVGRELNSIRRSRPPEWSIRRIAFVSELLRILLPLQDFNEKVRFSVFEMSQFLLDSKPPERDVFVRAVSGAFLLPSPFNKAITEEVEDWDMDYFRTTPEGKAGEHANDLGQYFDLVLAEPNGP